VSGEERNGVGRLDDHEAREAPLVSVIIPVFNGERFLAEAIESVFAQGYQPLEVIVVDDGSTDGSLGIARSFENVTAVRIEHAGAPGARNAGLARATGEFVTFLDADDRFTKGRLTAQLEHLHRHPEVGCVLMRQELLVESGVRARWIDPASADPGGVPIMSALLRRSVLDDVGGMDPRHLWSEGMDLLFRLRDAGIRIEVLPSVGLVRRIHAQNTTHHIESIRADLARAVREHIDRGRVERDQGIS
jgi:glycosyltransferase involved in cell wall biosynthesis